MTEAQQELIARLNAASPLDDAVAFVLLWTYFESIGLSETESGLVRRNILPRTIEPFPLRTDQRGYRTPKGRKWLAKEQHRWRFDERAASWLKGLDFILTRLQGTFEHQVIEGFDGRPYRVRPVNQFISSFFAHAGRGIAGNEKQSLSLAAYCRHFRVVPAFPMKGIRIECTTAARLGDPSIDDRLLLAIEDQLRFLCWPLRCELRMNRSDVEARLVNVTVAAEPAARRAELANAIEAARTSRAAILVLPELSTAAEDLAHLQQLLGAHGRDDHPLLTIAGLEHAPGDGAFVNEAVLLGPYGDVLHRHRKLARFSGDDLTEHIVTGTKVTVIESPIGNLCTLICLDLFNDAVEPVVTASHANVLLTPSLSNVTTAHQTAAAEYLASNLAATFVSNRSLHASDKGSNSTFALLPGKDEKQRTLLLRIAEDAEYLLVVVQ
jgi:Carbon-nitrogen hydrolase